MANVPLLVTGEPATVNSTGAVRATEVTVPEVVPVKVIVPPRDTTPPPDKLPAVLMVIEEFARLALGMFVGRSATTMLRKEG